MELSADRRYTSKLVLEDTTTVFQKTKEERSGKNKRIHALLREARRWRVPLEEQHYQGDPEIIEALVVLRLHVACTSTLTNVSQARVHHTPQRGSALLGL